MTAIVSAFWRICIFASGPNTIPANLTLAALVVSCDFLITLLALVLQSSGDITVLRGAAMAVVSLASSAGLVWLVLTMFGRAGRFTQTITAFVGVDLVLTLVSLATYLPLQALSPAMASIAALGIFLWTLGVYGFILHRALEVHIAIGMALSLFVVIFSVAITQTAIAQ